jgi:3-methyladenine DNA glycosylase/8-oxoguanine DNA glycosylase
LPARRAETIQRVARAVCSGELNFDTVMDTEAFLSRLSEIPGIGPWTTQYVAMRALGQPDAFPAGDVGLLRALHMSNSRALEERAEQWRPWRSYAALYLWNAGANRRH